MAVQFELEDLNMRPDPEPLLTEMIHEVKYTGSCMPHVPIAVASLGGWAPLLASVVDSGCLQPELLNLLLMQGLCFPPHAVMRFFFHSPIDRTLFVISLSREVDFTTCENTL